MSTFKSGTYKINLTGYSLNRSNEDVFTDKFEMLNVFQINQATDSLHLKQMAIRKTFSDGVKNSFAFFYSKGDGKAIDMGDMGMTLNPEKPKVIHWNNLSKNEQRASMNEVVSKLRRLNQNIANQKDFTDTIGFEEDQYWVEFHRKFALTYAIIVLFFIGAPLGAIIKKGGFGAPVVIAALIFMLYFILISVGENLSDTHVVAPWFGMWMAGLFFTPIALLIMRAAANDAPLFNRESWLKKWNKLKKKNAHTIS